MTILPTRTAVLGSRLVRWLRAFFSLCAVVTAAYLGLVALAGGLATWVPGSEITGPLGGCVFAVLGGALSLALAARVRPVFRLDAAATFWLCVLAFALSVFQLACAVLS